MKYIVLFQHSCDACSKVGKLVTSMSIDGLEARPLTDPSVVELLRSAGLQIPDRPSLLVVGDGDQVQVLTGWAMRQRLAAVVGWRRSGRIVQLLAAEWQARLARSARSGGPGRRTVIGGGLAGIAAWFMTGGIANASSGSGPHEPGVRLLGPTEAKQALATSAVREAVRTWGPADTNVYEITRNGESLLAVLHPRQTIITLVDNSRVARSGHPAAVSIGAATGAALRYYTISGTALGDLTSKGKVVAAPRTATARSDGEERPDIPEWMACWIECMNRHIIGGVSTCAYNCSSCYIWLALGGSWKSAPSCVYCIFCAGWAGVRCIGECG